MSVKILLSLILVHYHSVTAQNYLASTLIPPGYDRTVTPNIDNAPLPVAASIRINSFGVNERAQTITVDMFLCLEWEDYRIQDNDFDSIRLTSFGSLWMPSVNFRNAIASSTIVTLIRVETLQIFPPNQTLNFCSRLSVEFICILDLPNFPFDEQFCRFELENFDISRQDLRLSMHSIPGARGNSKFRVRNIYTGNCDPIPYNQLRPLNTWSSQLGTEHCAFLTVRLVRSINYYIIRYYAPTFFMVLISFTQFWMPTNAWPARIMLTVTIMVSLITVSLNGYNEIPSNDVAALYWWFWWCQFFIFAGMIEYSLSMAWSYFIMDKKTAKAAGKVSPDGRYFGKKTWYASFGISIGNMIRFVFGPLDHYRDPVNRSKVDYFSRIWFPIIWLFYVLLYIVSTIPVWTPKFYM